MRKSPLYPLKQSHTPVTEIYTAKEAELLNELIVHITPLLARDTRNKKHVNHLLDYALDLAECFIDPDNDDFEPLTEEDMLNGNLI
ncbi:hypothetical protein CYG68_21335 [Morganella morganii]|uniref:Uncharacterized protein n=1 Tax=Morganella morganii TaxID=582 RepID=A0A8I0U764_MORMO|nr:hypothetical protein [Morganella morganii]ELB1109561.1 hypothetical protein [Morganella morganii]MBE8614862.1 hypothetical protein [Morganella morganii]